MIKVKIWTDESLCRSDSLHQTAVVQEWFVWIWHAPTPTHSFTLWCHKWEQGVSDEVKGGVIQIRPSRHQSSRTLPGFIKNYKRAYDHDRLTWGNYSRFIHLDSHSSPLFDVIHSSLSRPFSCFIWKEESHNNANADPITWVRPKTLFLSFPSHHDVM